MVRPGRDSVARLPTRIGYYRYNGKPMKILKRRVKARAGGRWPGATNVDRTLFSNTARELAKIGKGCHARGWVLGTSGNFSAVISNQPLRLAITATGSDKGELVASQFLEIDEQAKVVRGNGRPSAETLLHLAIVRDARAGAVLHTHSVSGTVLSGTHARYGGIALEGYEMLKGLEGVKTHKHREWLPILENSQDMVELADRVTKTLCDHRELHGFLLREHGLYTWGANLPDAKRHLEILEFLMEVLVRSGAARLA